MYFSPETLQPYLDAGLVSEQRHPLAPHLRIYNYTHRTQYEQRWDEVTLHCRGLVIDREREEVIANCLKKHFNLEEHLQHGWPIPDELPIVTEKYDGWYGSLYWLNDEPWIATRGSFMSPGAQWATKWLRVSMAFMTAAEWQVLKNPAVTHIFEIIAPVTRIVVEYSFEGLVHLATIDRETDKDRLPLIGLQHIRQAKQIDADDYRTLTRQPYANSEGFVCLFPDAGVRIKMKFAEYVERHRLYTGLSVHTLWKMLYDGQGLEDIGQGLPDELYGWARQRVLAYQETVREHDARIRATHRLIMRDMDHGWGDNKTARDKAIALAFHAHEEEKILFLYHKYREALWRTIEPSGSETFRQDREES